MKRFLHGRAIPLSILVIFLVFGSFAWPAESVRAETITISESFSGIEAPGWNLLGSAELTAPGVDPAGSGWLRLTSADVNQAGAALYDDAFTTQPVLDIEFDYAAYGGTGANGLTFFIIDGDATPSAPGETGAGLGFVGLSGAFVAVGFDEEGDFGDSEYANVTIRDAGHGLTSTQAYRASNRDDPTHVRILFINNHVSVWIAWDPGTWVIKDFILPVDLPQTIRFGFSGATGELTNFHEITNVVITLHSPAILRAKPSGSSARLCGQTWSTACNLKTALETALPGDEIWVAQGVHKPFAGPSDRSATFQLVEDVPVYGGFDGVDDAALSDRDFLAHPTILSGDIDDNDSQKPVITDIESVTGNDTNSYHVVTGATGATLDGFTITAGHTVESGYVDTEGGGMLNEFSNPVVANVTFMGNWALGGGGMYNNYSVPTLNKVTFNGNWADGSGGGMSNRYSDPILTDITFNGNQALFAGGGMDNQRAYPMIHNVVFADNQAGASGGGIYSSMSFVVISNAIFINNNAGSLGHAGNGGAMVDGRSDSRVSNASFIDNSATSLGGAVYNVYTFPIYTNVTFMSNKAAQGGAMANSDSSPALINNTFNGNYASGQGGAIYSKWRDPIIHNSLFWGNSAAVEGANFFAEEGTVNISDSVVQGGYSGTHIITEDPLLGPFGDYGGFSPTIPLYYGSSATDQGNPEYCPATDQRGVARPAGEPCDIGAFEGEILRSIHLPLIMRFE